MIEQVGKLQVFQTLSDKDEVDAARENIREIGWEEKGMQFDADTPTSYFLIPIENTPMALPDTVISISGQSPCHGAIIAVSAAMRESTRHLPAFAGYYQSSLESSSPARCLRSTVEEIKRAQIEIVSDAELKEYLLARSTFFANLLRYVVGTPGITKEDMNDLEASGRLFEIAARQYK